MDMDTVMVTDTDTDTVMDTDTDTDTVMITAIATPMTATLAKTKHKRLFPLRGRSQFPDSRSTITTHMTRQPGTTTSAQPMFT
jgi:hypothetical protein